MPRNFSEYFLSNIYIWPSIDLIIYFTFLYRRHLPLPLFSDGEIKVQWDSGTYLKLLWKVCWSGKSTINNILGTWTLLFTWDVCVSTMDNKLGSQGLGLRCPTITNNGWHYLVTSLGAFVASYIKWGQWIRNPQPSPNFSFIWCYNFRNI